VCQGALRNPIGGGRSGHRGKLQEKGGVSSLQYLKKKTDADVTGMTHKLMVFGEKDKAKSGRSKGQTQSFPKSCWKWLIRKEGENDVRGGVNREGEERLGLQ